MDIAVYKQTYEQNETLIQNYKNEQEQIEQKISKLLKVNEHLKAILDLTQDKSTEHQDESSVSEGNVLKGAEVRELVISILQKENKPLESGELWDRFIALGYRTSGKRPRATFGAYLTNTKEMKKPMFFKTMDGKWGLPQWTHLEFETKKDKDPESLGGEGSLPISDDNSNSKEEKSNTQTLL